MAEGRRRGGGVYASIVAEFNAKGLKDAETAFKKFGQAVTAAVATRAVVDFARSAINATSDLAEVQSKSNVIFGDSVNAVQAFAEEAARSFGQSERAALDAASTFGVFGKSAGLTGDDLSKFALDLTGLASDLASFSNTTTDEAILALGSALRGEAEPLRRYGVMLDDATLKAQAMEMGIYSGNGALTTQQKILAANAVIFEQTSDAQGDFARTSEGVANQQRILNAELENARAVAGEALVPIFRDMLTVAGGLLKTFDKLSPNVKTFAVQASLAAAAALALSNGMKSMGVNANFARGASVVLATALFAVAKNAEEEAKTLQTAAEWRRKLGEVSDTVLLDRYADALTVSALAGQSAYEAAYDIVQQSPELARRLLDVANAAGINDEGIQALRFAYTDFNTAQINAERTQSKFADSTDDSAMALLAQEEAQRQAEQAARDAADALEAQLQLQRDLVNASLANISQELAYEDQTRQTADAIAEYAALQAEIIAGDYEGENAARDLADAMSAIKNEAVANAEAAIRWAEQQATLNGETLSASEIYGIQVAELQKVASQLAPNSPLRKQLEGYISQLKNDLPKDVQTVIEAEYQAKLYLETLRYGYIEFEKRAAGGPVTAGSPYIVGEIGPELFIPEQSGTIVPNRELVSGSMTTMGTASVGSGVTLNVTVTNPVASGEQLANELAAYTRRNGSRWLAGVV